MLKRILIAEDDFYILDVYSSSFSAAGYTVDTAADGQQVMEKLKTNTYDLLLIDIMLPKVSGMEILDWCRSQNTPLKDIPIYFVSNLDEDVFVKKALAQGANGYYRKTSLTSEALVEKVDAALKAHNSL